MSGYLAFLAGVDFSLALLVGKDPATQAAGFLSAIFIMLMALYVEISKARLP